MTDATERLVNLAFFLAHASEPVKAEQVRAEVYGYPADQPFDAFIRMFERDKDLLREAGLVLHSDAEGHYRLDPSATYAQSISLTTDEAAAIRAVGVAMLEDPAFPFHDDLRFALAKLATAGASPGAVPLQAPALVAVAALADENPEQQGADVAALDSAVSARKTAEFDYTNNLGDHKHHVIEPYGLFARDGRWYLVGRDTALDQVRVYTISRMERLSVNSAKMATPDFERPADFDVARFIGLPFQYGPGPAFDAVIEIAEEHAWRADLLAAGKGEVERGSDGVVRWTVSARSEERLLSWVIENGPGLKVVSPNHADSALRAGLARVIAAHETEAVDA